MVDVVTKVVTIGGSGTRLKSISPSDKQNLYWGRMRIIEWIKSIFPDCLIIGEQKTNSRLETLKMLEVKENILVIDCDIIPLGIDLSNLHKDTIWFFQSKKEKYGSLIFNKDGELLRVSEGENISPFKSSGAYFIKDLEKTLKSMEHQPNSIAGALIGGVGRLEETFVRMGDVEDYLEAIKIKRPYDNSL